MKRYLDDFFCKKLESGSFVVAADVGYFPKARSYKNFIDVGNDETAIGSVVYGIAATGKDVYVYDICGYTLKNGYSGFAYRHRTKGKIVILSWGSGFAYDGCLLGHYPIDDIHLAKLCNFDIHLPYNKNTFMISLDTCTNQDSYIRMFNLDEWEYKGTSNINSKIKFIAEGWIAHFLEDSFGEHVYVQPYIDGLKRDNSAYYFTDQIQIESNKNIIGPVHPLQIDEKSYECKEAFLKNCFIEPIKELLGLE